MYYKEMFMKDAEDKRLHPDLLTDDEIEQLMVEDNQEEYNELNFD